MSEVLAPLYSLLKKDTRWRAEKAFETAKKSLEQNSLLVHYDPSKDLLVSCDASPYGVGAVLSHQMEDDTERPIVFISRTLSPAD